ncbi:MAG: sugar ABC transporter permease [Betaproteobacteria bacterium]
MFTRKRRRHRAHDDAIDAPWVGWALFAPAALFLVTYTYYPAIATFVTSLFSDPKAGRASRFIGIENYRSMIDDPIFVKALANNAWYALGTIPLSIALAVLMALLVNRALPGRVLVRMAYFAPTVLAMVAVANIWLLIYSPQIGPLNALLSLFGRAPHNWLGQPDTALGSVIAVAIWKEAGFFMIFYLAALQSLPLNLAEAAALEGASRWYFFWRVTFPLLMPTTLFVLVNAIVNAFRLVDHIIVMTKGGPDNASMLLLYYVYETGFRYWETSYAAAMSMVLLVILGVVAIGQFLLLERRTHYR